jgi:RHS repeat-associated protein
MTLRAESGIVRVGARVSGAAFALCLFWAVLPPPAHAAAQLTSFGVDNPSPPETQPSTSGKSSRRGVFSTTTADDLPANDPAVGTMLGQAGVDGGAATYSVPIVVPPGRAGMQPSLSLNYNSRSGDGVAGMGWTISGISSIHRCPQTPEQDGKSQGVSYTNSDRLCLDGQRLVVTNGKAYGASGAQYHTEVDSHARITQVGGNLVGNSTCFVVEQRDGRILHYGAVVNDVDSGSPSCAASSANARVQPAGVTSTLSWLVQQIQDRAGNDQRYSYTNYGNGEVLLHQVRYTGFGGTVGNRTVTFAYESRTEAASSATDVSSSYLAGGLTMQTKALQAVTTAVAGTPARTYTPAYVVSRYSGRLLMAKLTECASNASGTACHPATKFTYNDDALSNTANAKIVSMQGFGFTPSSASLNAPYQIHVIGDLDGDGTKEAAITVHQLDGPHNYLAQMTGDRAIHNAVYMTVAQFCVLPECNTDFDGSGRNAQLEYPASGAGPIDFRVWNLDRGEVATGDPFTTVTSNLTSVTLGGVGQSQRFFAADFDGDGKSDLLLLRPTGCGSTSMGTNAGAYFYRNTTSGALSTSNPANFDSPVLLFCLPATITGSNGITTYYRVPKIDHLGDFNADGLPDVYLVNAGLGDSTSSSLVGSFAGIELTQRSGSTIGSSAIIHPLTCDTPTNTTSTTDECNWQYGYATHWMDVNGDGLEDFVIARPYQNQWQIRLNQGNASLAPAIAVTTSGYAGLDSFSTTAQGGLITSAFRYANGLPTMDADSDGKPDILVPSQTQGVHGFALKMCTLTKFAWTVPATEEQCPTATNTNAPVSADGILAQGQVNQCPIYYCPDDPGALTPNLPHNINHVQGDKSPVWAWNNLPAYGTYSGGPQGALPQGSRSDLSVYHLAMLKFVQTGPSAFSAKLVETPMVSRLNDGFSQADDLFGDGLSDLTTAVGCDATYVTNGSPGDSNYWSYPHCSVVGSYGGVTYGPETFPDGTANSTFANQWQLYASINQGVAAFGGSLAKLAVRGFAPRVRPATTGTTSLADPPILPGLLDTVSNGIGDVAAWSYSPLSVPLDPADYGGLDFYSVDGDYRDSRHYYFQSSMPVVQGFGQMPGNSAGTMTYTGFRASIYAYADAMYNHFGRGFMGFRKITSESGDYATDHRLTRTVTTYNQKFPLIGKVAEVVTSVPNLAGSVNTVVRDETDNYICTLSNRLTCPTETLTLPTGDTVYTPVLDSRIVKTYDLGTGAQDGETDTYNYNGGTSGWDAFGNLTYQAVTRSDKGSPIFVFSHTTTTQNTFDTSDTTDWWLDKLTQTSVTASIAYASGHALPVGASAPSQTVTTDYTWNTDRTPATKTVQSGITNQRSTTAYTYPSPNYGLPTLTKICLGGFDANGDCTGDVAAALSPERTTAFTYTSDGATASADGYFVLTATNALNQTATTTHQTGDGQVLTATDPNGVQTVTTYDAFGRATRVRHLGNDGSDIESPIHSAWTSCLNASGDPGHCPSADVGEDGNEANAAYRITTVQTGYPTQVAWYDLLGRTIKQGHRGFDGTFIATIAEYDDMGTVADISTPYFIGDTAYFTGWSYDALNRPTQKIAPGSEMDPVHGNVQTDYRYSGRTTSLTVHGTGTSARPNANGTCKSTNGNLCLAMSRSQNVLGQWMQTTQSPILNGATTTLTTNYWTEPLGHVAAMEDAEGNLTTAMYNALGQRIASHDPDQGDWSFDYDALGELLTQTDARGVTTTINSRDALGRTTQRQQVPPSALPGLAYETVLDDWTYDPVNGIGEIDSVARRRGSGTTVPTSTATPVWQESYGYEPTTARPSTITTTIHESGTVVLDSAMDYDTDGRPSTHTYPSGLTVQDGYTDYGQLDQVSNQATGTAYWTATAANAWDHVTGESFYGSIVGSHQDYASTGQAYKLQWTGKDKFLYGYDSFGNLVSQSRSITAGNGESFQYDPLQRLTKDTRSTGAAVNFGYSASGNLTKKDDFSTTAANAYSYASANSTTNGCGPHAANSVALPSGTATYTCDPNGNVIGGDTINATFDADNHPRTLVRTNLSGGASYEPCATGHADTIFCDGYEVLPTSQTSGSATWAYDTNGNRYYEYSAGQGARYFGPAGYELQNGVAKQELGPVIVTGNGASVTVVLKDRLGSTLDTIDGSTLTQRAYAPFGATRNGDMSDRQYGSLNLLPDTIHGFTGHTHEDDVALIHMGGRIYDYSLGRFLSVDPLVQNPLSSQSLNPYSYVGNNPLSGKDPTGYASTQDCKRTGDCMSDFDRMAGFKNAYVAHDGGKPHGNGASGQGADSIAHVTAGEQGNPSHDRSSAVNGNPASPDSNGGGQKATASSNADLGVMSDYGRTGPDPEKGLEPVGIAGFDNIAIDLASYGNTVQQNGFFSKAAGIGLLGLGLDAVTAGRGRGAIQELETITVTAVGDLRSAGLKDAHHIIQDAAVRDLPGYNSRLAPGVQLRGPSTALGTPHYLATQVQRQAGGGTYAAERRIGYKALRAAGYSEGDARQAIKQVDAFFDSIGVTPSTSTRIPGNRD